MQYSNPNYKSLDSAKSRKKNECDLKKKVKQEKKEIWEHKRFASTNVHW